MASKPTTIDEYLAALNHEQRAALENLRKTIKAAAPEAEECISYGLATFRHGKLLVSFGATPNHCAFYVMSSTTIEASSSPLPSRFGKSTLCPRCALNFSDPSPSP